MTDAEDDQHTCGKGVAANAVLPERIAALLHAMADIFENHIRALNPNEGNAKREIDAYRRLMRDYRAAAAPVSALADAMRGYRDLPLAEHAIAVLMDSQSVDAMDTLVHAQEALLTLLRERAAEFRGMLEAMKTEGR
jgi:hypothetical protein